MLRFHAILSLFAGGLFAVPALRSQEPQGVREALSQTVQALEHLAGLEQRQLAGEPVPTAEILAVTEAPSGTAMERDAFLATLREEVAGLAQHHDNLLAGLSAPSFPTLPAQPAPAEPEAQGDSSTPTTQVSPTTGLPDGMRRTLFDGLRPIASLPEHITRNPRAKKSFELDGYSADPLREGRLYCRARRFAEAIAILEPIQDVPEAAYWIANAYEGLGRHEEALGSYTSVAEGDSEFAARAKRDLDFLQWKMDFEARTQRGQREKR